METVQNALFQDIYYRADEIAKKGKQVTGKNSDYYITLEQLEAILMRFDD